MKQVLLLFLVFFSASLFAQTTIDWDTTGQSWSPGVFGGAPDPVYSVVPNPDMTGINTSATCAQLVIDAAAQHWAGAFFTEFPDFTLDANNCIVKIMVYKDVISPFNLKLEGPNIDQRDVSNTVVNQWEELTFDYSAYIGTEVLTLTIIPDHEPDDPGRTHASTNYFDNIRFTPNVIPVELSSFTASVGNNGIELKWNTASEINNKGFDVEKRLEGTAKFEKIGFVIGQGTTINTTSYSYLDKNASGKLYYRLKQIDTDGSFEYSPTIEVDASKLVKFELSQNFPNPFNPSTTIKYSVPDQSFVTIKVYDVLGNEIIKLVNEAKDAGIYEINFNAANLSSGIYYYSISAGNFSDTKKFMLMK